MKLLKLSIVALALFAIGCADKKAEETNDLEKTVQEIETTSEDIESSNEEISKELEEVEKDLEKLDSITQ